MPKKTNAKIDYPCHSELSDEVQAQARSALRSNIRECAKYRTDDLDADVIIEQVWNALTGRAPK